MVDEPLAWLEAVGIDPAGLRPKWKVHVELETHGDIPGPVWSEGRAFAEPPAVGLDRGAPRRPRVVSFRQADRQARRASRGRHVGGDHAARRRPAPHTLASIPRWLTRCEEKLDIRFRRDRPRIRSDIKGGAKAMARWIAPFDGEITPGPKPPPLPHYETAIVTMGLQSPGPAFSSPGGDGSERRRRLPMVVFTWVLAGALIQVLPSVEYYSLAAAPLVAFAALSCTVAGMDCLTARSYSSCCRSCGPSSPADSMIEAAWSGFATCSKRRGGADRR